MKPRSKSVWMTPAACGAVAPRLIVQARDSFGPAVRKVCRPSVAKPTRASWSMPGFLLTHRLQQLQRLVVGQLDQLGLGLGVEEDRLGRRDEGAQLVGERLRWRSRPGRR